jgi:hypothetical protein
MQMRRFEIVRSDTDTLTSHSGLALVGRALGHTRLERDLAVIPLRHGIPHADCVKSYVGLLSTAKSDFDAIENRREDAFFRAALDVEKVPSAPSLRQRFDEHASAMIPIVDAAATDFIASVGAPVTPIMIRYGTSLHAVKHKYVVLDIDVFPMDNSGTKKEGVGYTYKGFNGYAPLAAYLGEEGWCLACELRPGSQHGQKEFVFFLERVVPRARRLTRHRLLARLDSGHDAAENRAWFSDDGVDFIIKWNPRRQPLEAWLKRAEKEATWTAPREGKRVGIFSETIAEEHDGEVREFRRVMRVIERTIDRDGNRLLVPKVTVEGWWTSLGEVACADDKVIALYCEHVYIRAVPLRVQDRPRHRAAALGQIRHQRSGHGVCRARLQHSALDRAHRLAARRRADPARRQAPATANRDPGVYVCRRARRRERSTAGAEILESLSGVSELRGGLRGWLADT